MRFYRKKILCAVFILAGFQAFAQDSDQAANKVRVGTLAFVKGPVKLNGLEGRNGDPLFGDSIIETKKGSCTLLIGEEIVVHIGKDSVVHVGEYLKERYKEKASIELKYGRIRALVGNEEKTEKDIKIKSRSSVMGVRGTHIVIETPQNEDAPIEFTTLEGSAEVQLEPELEIQSLMTNQAMSEETGVETISETEAVELSGEVVPPQEPTETQVEMSEMTGFSTMSETEEESFMETQEEASTTDDEETYITLDNDVDEFLDPVNPDDPISGGIEDPASATEPAVDPSVDQGSGGVVPVDITFSPAGGPPAQ